MKQTDCFHTVHPITPCLFIAVVTALRVSNSWERSGFLSVIAFQFECWAFISGNMFSQHHDGLGDSLGLLIQLL